MKPMASVTVNFVQKLFSLKNKNFFQKDGEAPSQADISENALVEIQKIIVWDDPFFSCCCIIFVNIIFWLIIYLDLKFYGIIFVTLTILTCEQIWTEHFSKYLSQNVEGPSRMSDDSVSRSTDINSLSKKALILLKEIYVNAKILRQSQPGMFCIMTCTGFLLLGVLGKWFSGVFTFYILLMLIMTVPGVLIRFLSPEVVKCIKDLINSSRQDGSSDSDEVEPYLPDTSEEALELLKLAGDLELPNAEGNEGSNDLLLERINEDTSGITESVSGKFSLYPELVTMPSPENSMDFWEFDLPSEEKAKLNLPENSGINFKSKYFDGESSEEEFINSLTSPEGSEKKSGMKNKVEQSKKILGPESFTSSGKKLFSTNMKQECTASDKESSSDTDSFELISEDDV